RDLASKRKTLNGRIAKLGTEVGMMKARLMSAVKKGIVACVFALLAVSQAPASPLHFCRGCWHNRSCTPDGAKPFGFPAGVQQPQKQFLVSSFSFLERSKGVPLRVDSTYEFGKRGGHGGEIHFRNRWSGVFVGQGAGGGVAGMP